MRIGNGRLIGGRLGDGVGIKQGQVGVGAFLQHAPVLEAKVLRRQPGHLVDGFFQRKQTERAAVVAQYARKTAPQARMGRRIVRQAVGADHGFVKLQDALHIGFVHAEINRAGRIQAGDRLFLGHAHFFGNVGEVLPGVFGQRFGPGDNDAGGGGGAVRRQDGGTGGVGVTVKAHRLLRHALFDEGECFGGATVVGLPDHLVVRDHHRHAHFAADAKGLLERVHHTIRFIAHVGAIKPAKFLQRPAGFDHLFGRRGNRRFVEQAGGNPDRARGEGIVHQCAHAGDLGRVRRQAQVVHGRDAQGGVPDKQRAIGGGRLCAQGGDVFGECLEMKPAALVIEQIERRGHRLRNGTRHGRKRNTAIAGDDRGDALADFGRHVRPGQHQAVIVGMRVDETGRGDASAQIDFDITVQRR